MNLDIVSEINASNKNAKNAAGEHLTFTLGDESYGIEILKVQEIRGYDLVTAIANTPDFIKGVVNLRGKIVPIVDLRIKFHFNKVDYDESTVVIILILNGCEVGIVVDGVSDVRVLKEEQISDVPSLVASIDTKYIVGLASLEDEMFILVDIEKLLSDSELSLITELKMH